MKLYCCLTLFLFLFFAPSNSHAQYISIPDTSFEKKLIELGIDNDGLNGEINANRISQIDTLSVPYSSITDLSGIEGFISLKALFINGNPITHLDISKNKNLIWLLAEACQLQSIHLDGCYNLKYLTIASNKLSQINLTSLNSLEVLTAYSNNFKELDISQNLNLTYLAFSFNNITSLSTTENKHLEIINCNNTPISMLDLSRNTQLNQINCTNTPNLFTICVPDKQLADSNSDFKKDSNDTWVDDCNTVTLINKGEKELITKIYPNPSRGIITIEVEEESHVLISDILGKEVLNTTIPSGSTTLSIHDLEKNLYLVRIQRDNSHSQQVIKLD